MTSKRSSKARSRSDRPLAVNGWVLLAHPLFLGQLSDLFGAVEAARKKDASTYRSTPNAKVLAALFKLVFEKIPADPTLPEYRQGDSLGEVRRHWFRAKFGRQRFRLFFRYDSKARIIVFAWVNDTETLRTYGARTDAYAVFSSMLGKGNPPDDWTTLKAACEEPAASARLAKVATALRAFFQLDPKD